MKYVCVGFLMLSLIACNDREKRDKALKDLDLTQQQLVAVNKYVDELKSLLTTNIGNLEIAKDDLNQVKQFQLLRTEQEREQQIRNATENILKIEENIKNIQSNIEYYKDSAYRTEMAITRLEEYLKN